MDLREHELSELRKANESLTAELVELRKANATLTEATQRKSGLLEKERAARDLYEGRANALQDKDEAIYDQHRVDVILHEAYSALASSAKFLDGDKKDQAKTLNHIANVRFAMEQYAKWRDADKKREKKKTIPASDYLDTIQAMLEAAGVDFRDIDSAEQEVFSKGSKPSHFIKARFVELRKANAELLERVTNARACASTLQAERDTLKADLYASEGQISDLVGELTRLRDELAAVKTDCQKLINSNSLSIKDYNERTQPHER